MTLIAVEVCLHNSKCREALRDALGRTHARINAPSSAGTLLAERIDVLGVVSIVVPCVEARPVDQVV